MLAPVMNRYELLHQSLIIAIPSCQRRRLRGGSGDERRQYVGFEHLRAKENIVT